MKSWRQAVSDAALSGGIAGVVSSLVLAWRGRLDIGAGAAPLNAPAHWFADEALGQDRPSWRYTVAGMLVHHLSSLFWAVFYERAGPTTGRPPAAAWRDAAAITAAAAVVDLQLVPRRFTPGFERRLSVRSLWLVYASFAAGLALASAVAGKRSRTGAMR